MAPMLAFRSFAIGLTAACFALLVMRPAVVLRVVPVPLSLEASYIVDEPPLAAAPTIVDVAPGVTAAQLASAIRLAPGEHIVAVDDVAVAGDVGAGVLLAARELRSNQFIDFTVVGPAGERRVLALLH